MKLFEYFEYAEYWRVLPFYDARVYFWRLDGEGPGCVLFAETEDNLKFETGDYYTMIVVDTHVDGNQFLQIFDNMKERPSPTI